jgi:hypothetical protein
MALVIANSSRGNACSSKPGRDRKALRRSRCVLPRRVSESSGRSSYEERKDGQRPAQRSRPRANSDEEVLSLRDSGRTYSAVARSLGFKRARDAQAAFVRALHKREGDERERLTQRERGRLDQLEQRIRTRDAEEPEKMERRLTALAKLREMVG